MKITRKFTVRPTEPDLNLSMSVYFINSGITVRMNGSETVAGPKGPDYKDYEGKLTMTVGEAFKLISDLQTAILFGFRQEVK